MRFAIVLVLSLLALTLAAFAVRSRAADPPPAAATLNPQRAGGFPRRVERPASPLHNLIQVSPRLYSGSEPLGTEPLAEIKQLGIKTIVSVDGSVPPVEAAKEFGMRYIHIPIGYDGVHADQAAALARVAREVEGPLYVHCHHGKHRGPAAAAICAMADGTLDHEGATALLKLAQTGADYAGLWRDVAGWSPPPADAPLPVLVEVADVEPLAAAMARVDRLSDELKASRLLDGKTTPAAGADSPAPTALLLGEELQEAARNLSQGYGDDFSMRLQSSADSALKVSRLLKDGRIAAASTEFDALQSACTACHKEYRN